MEVVFVKGCGTTTVSNSGIGTVKRELYQQNNSSTSSTNVLYSPYLHFKSTDNDASLGWTAEVPTKTSRNIETLAPDKTKTGTGIKTALRTSKKPFENGG